MSPSKIYYVEDDIDDAQLLSEVFSEKGYEIRIFPDPVELFHQLHADELLPTLIILDLNLPRMTGAEALRLLSQEPKFYRIPVAILSTSPRSGQSVDEKQLYFMKPAEYGDYGAIVSRLLAYAGHVPS
ncbi:response regulator [Flaviaesturariibacter aridisoli]|uniref:Response regulator n=1 Tax=Flaviaesturariibacter aridisoli TaxID=2545761 RepID=A0A4R4DXQ8_9BACT|nr:response regulator [Flaviaesturariibacter aridisoli]TCZ68077.1 response regulator [Flaviaesturariibacter aridisoli]